MATPGARCPRVVSCGCFGHRAPGVAIWYREPRHSLRREATVENGAPHILPNSPDTLEKIQKYVRRGK